MWFYKYALKWYDEGDRKEVRECGITVGTDIKDAIDRLYQMYGDFWDCHIDFCGEDSENCLLNEGIEDYLKWREKYVDNSEA